MQAAVQAPDLLDEGHRLLFAGRLPEAAAKARERLVAAPDDPQALDLLAIARHREGAKEEALLLFARAAALQPDDAGILTNYGACLRSVGRLDEAVATLSRALALAPGLAETHYDLGIAHLEAGRFAEAERAQRRALALRPGFATSHHSLAHALLSQGRLAEAWPHYERRWEMPDFPTERHAFGRPRWDGRPLNGRTILIHSEQGLGDVIQFCRYLPMVRDRGGKVILQLLGSHRGLKRLMGTLDGVDSVMIRGEGLPAFDCHLPMMSLPPVFGTTNATIPAAPVPYLRAPAAETEAWRRRFSVLPGPRIGIAWAGNRLHRNDAQRSVPIEALAPLARAIEASWIGLVIGERAGDWIRFPADRRASIDGAVGDVADTAAALLALDLVITCDTALAHLAGALGRPTWLLLPSVTDWRWYPDAAGSPWYPTMRLFRQGVAGDWSAPVAAVAAALRSWTPVPDTALPIDPRAEIVDGPAPVSWLPADAPPGAMPATPGDILRIGARHVAAGRLDQADAAFRAALAAMPDQPGAIEGLAHVARARGHLMSALWLLERVARLTPEDPAILAAVGLAQIETGQPGPAAQTLQKVVTMRPEDGAAWSNLGNAFSALGRHGDAVGAQARAARLMPGDPQVHGNLAHALIEAGRLADAAAVYGKAGRLAPGDPRWPVGQGVALKDLGRMAEALVAFEQAVVRDPTHGSAQWNRALALLALGDYRRGWPAYEWRFRKEGRGVPERRMAVPRWEGEPLDGKTVLLHSEQGAGDTIQFLRFASAVAARGGRVVIETPSPLAALAGRIAGVAEVVLPTGRAHASDVHLPLMSAPGVLGIELADIGGTPYMTADPAKARRWADRLGALGPGRRIGIAWSGSPTHANDARRSIPPKALGPLFDVPGIAWVSLQRDRAPMPAWGAADVSAALTDFDETAALMDGLDLVISVDTATAHLAGALGKPVWVLLPLAADWRWLIGREDSPWYASARLFRQPRAGDWPAVIQAVAGALAGGALP